MNNKDWKQALPDFIKDATNIYRTKYFIVKQIISIRFDKDNYNALISIDTFYARTKERDSEYDYFISPKNNSNGKRIKTAMSSRTYIY